MSWRILNATINRLVQLPNGRYVEYLSETEATRMADAMNREAVEDGIDVRYEVKRREA